MIKKLKLTAVFILTAVINSSAASVRPTGPWYIGEPNAADVNAIVSGDTLYVNGIGRMAAIQLKDSADMPGNIKIALIKGDISNIGIGVFQNFTGLESVSIANSITSIGTNAFQGCIVLKSISMPNSVTSIGDYAFKDCNLLSSVSLSTNTVNIGVGVFEGCSGLYTISIPSKVANIGSNAFRSSGLNTIVIPGNVVSINGFAFQNCQELKSVTLSNGLISIGANAFDECPKLTSIIIPYSVTHIDAYTFNHCGALRRVTLPSSITSIGAYAFGSTALRSFTVPSSVTSIGDYAFYSSSTSTLTEINSWAATPPQISDNTFGNISPLPEALVREESSAAYLMSKWNVLGDIQSPPNDNSNAYLDSILVGGKAVPVQTDSTQYTCNVPRIIDNVVIKAFASGGAQISGTGKVSLKTMGDNFFDITVMSADSTLYTNYRLNIVRGGSNTAVETEFAAEPLLVYPNPTSDGTLIVGEGQALTGSRIEVYGADGSLCAVFNANDGANVINIGHLPAGTYIVQAGGKTAKIVKQ